MAYKIVACDFDDTLFSNKTHSISQANIDAINMCEAKGIRFVLASGRSLPSIQRYYEALKLKTPMITTGGAEVYDKDLNRIYSSMLGYDDIMMLLKRAKQLGVHAHVYKNGYFCYEKDSPIVEFYVKHTGMKGQVIPDLMDKPKEWFESPKLLMMAEPDKITEIQKQLAEEYPHLNVVKSLNMFVEFYDKQTSKGNALKFLIDYMGYSMDETVAVGDTQIDISMLKAAKLSAAPANSMSDVLAIADIILNDCEHDSIAQLLNEYVFDK